MSKQYRIMVVDDNELIGRLFLDALQSSIENDVVYYKSPLKALDVIADPSIDLAVIDYRLPDMNGLELIRRLNSLERHPEILFITGYPENEIIDQALSLGVTFILLKPFDMTQIYFAVYAALSQVRRKRARARQLAVDDLGITGLSAHVNQLRNEIHTFAGSTVPVLIQGETGAGKELIARGLHNASPRREKPFIVVNCATLSLLADSQLFGHVKGSFTGAIRSTIGFVGSADGGTLFLDEVGDIPPETQPKLLRFLDSGDYTPIGSGELRQADVRVVCATNLDLKKRVAEGQFREDLYYRISGARLMASPLRDRIEDVPPLVYKFMQAFAKDDKDIQAIATDAVAALTAYPWPGNVRQLRQILRVLTLRCRGREITLDDVHSELGHSKSTTLRPYREAKAEVLSNFDRKYFTDVAALSGGSLNKALQITDMHKKNFYQKMSECELSLAATRANDVRTHQ